MGLVPNIRKILAENFPDLDWMPRLAAPINIFMEQTIRLLTKGLSFKDNFDGDLFEVTADGQYPIKIAWNVANKPVAVWIGQANRTTGEAATFTNALQLVWRFNESRQIEITDILGLDDSSTKKYNLVIIGVTG